MRLRHDVARMLLGVLEKIGLTRRGVVGKDQPQTRPEWVKWFKDELKEMGLPPGAAFEDGGWNLKELLLLWWQAKREVRGAKLWWIALFSAIASVLSAAAAWVAVATR